MRTSAPRPLSPSRKNEGSSKRGRDQPVRALRSLVGVLIGGSSRGATRRARHLDARGGAPHPKHAPLRLGKGSSRFSVGSYSVWFVFGETHHWPVLFLYYLVNAPSILQSRPSSVHGKSCVCARRPSGGPATMGCWYGYLTSAEESPGLELAGY